jgi:hypothetical protein
MAQMQSSPSGMPKPLNDVTYDIVTELHEAGRATSILKTYIDDASKVNDSEAARVFEQIRQDKLRHCEMLRDLVKDEIQQGRF